MIQVSQDWILANAQQLCPITTMRCFITQIQPYLLYEWGKDRIKSVKISQHGDILSGAISDYEIIVEVDNSGNSAITTAKAEKLCGLQLYVEFGYQNIQEISDFRYFVYDTQIKSDTDTVVFTAKSSLSFMTNTYSNQNIKQGTAFDIAEAALNQAAGDSYVPKSYATPFQFQIDDSLEDFNISLDSTDYTIAEVLQIVANASKSVLRVNSAGMIIIAPRNKEMQLYSILQLVQFSQITIEIDKPIQGCILYCSGGGARVVSESVTNGKFETIKNMSLVYDASYAAEIARWATQELSENPRRFSCVYRADPRAEIFDVIQLDNSGEIRQVVVTDLSYTYNGAWTGEITARDNGEGLVDAERVVDIYNAMMEYLASVQNGSGNYQDYTNTFQAFVEHLGQPVLDS